jgi:hypothetical protein
MTPLRGRAELLEASRRVDWRFLLSDPALGEVVYVGRRNEALIEACSAFASRVSVLDPLTPMSDGVEADTVVAVDPRADELRTAAERLRGGGWLYAEFSGFTPAAIRHARRPSLSRRCARALERLGFEDVRRHWHWPTFAACTEIIPIAEPEALRHWLVRREADGTPAKAVLARIVIALRLPTFFAFATSVVGRRPGGAA